MTQTNPLPWEGPHVRDAEYPRICARCCLDWPCPESSPVVMGIDPSTGEDSVASVIVWQNGMVMVFDVDGQQIPSLQGPIEEMRERLEKAFPREKWEYRDWNEGRMNRSLI